MTAAKHPSFVVRSAEPLCGGPDLGRLVAHAETPVEDLFVRNHGAVPAIDANTHMLAVDGLVHRPLALRVAELEARYSRTQAIVTMQCAGNRRDELAAVRPIPGEVPWGAEAVGTARWSGFRLADVLADAGVAPGAAYVAFEGLDRITRDGSTFGFGASIALERALAGDVLLADRLADGPLPPEHGHPLRLVVPGFVGARSVKWLGRVTVQAEPSNNHFQARAYRILPPDADPHTSAWDAVPPIEEAPLQAVIAAPAAGSVTGTGPVTVAGYATGRGLHPVTGVEVGLADAVGAVRRWLPAELLDAPAPGRWVRWRAVVEPAPGPFTVVARAHDASGVPQPAEPAERWNPKGYLNDAWHRVLFVAEPARTR